MKEIDDKANDEGDWVAGVKASPNDHSEHLEIVEAKRQTEQEAPEKAEAKSMYPKTPTVGENKKRRGIGLALSR